MLARVGIYKPAQQLWSSWARNLSTSTSNSRKLDQLVTTYPNTQAAKGDKAGDFHGDNIVIIGSPGSGKTSVGKRLSSLLGRPAIDIDDDHLESYWGMTVAEKLQQVGEENFVKEEGEALLNFNASGSVVTLSGSNPLHRPAMNHVRESSLVVFLDVQHKDIVSRLERMKVDRIVGQKPGTPIQDLLDYRQQFYENNYDIRILCEPQESLDSVASKVVKALETREGRKGYLSTRGGVPKSEGVSKTFSDVVLEGLAPDGGLYVSADKVPQLSTAEWKRLLPLSYNQLALRVLEKWINPMDLHPSILSGMIDNAYSPDNFTTGVCPVVHLHGNQYVVELFHGPSASFKDMALQLMPQFFHQAVASRGSPHTGDKDKYLILVATSGDTGGAVLDGFGRHTGDGGTRVMVLYPENGISGIQKAQMTSAVGSNVKVTGVESDFDFCQSIIKQIFNDPDLPQQILKPHSTKLSAANSINWGRLLPQVVYHVWGYLQLVHQGVIALGDPVDLCIPTGNFGNILAAFYAKEMGIPFCRLICASNKNNILTEFIQTGLYNLESRKLHITESPAIDILKSSNLERYLYYVTNGNFDLVRKSFAELDRNGNFQVPHETLERIRSDFVADWCTEEECLETITDTYAKTGYILDPHTAVAKQVGDRLNTGHRPMLLAATAHYAKFAPSILRALKKPAQGDPKSMFEALESLRPSPSMHQPLTASVLRERLHQDVCKANKNEVIQQVERYIAGSHSM